MSTSIGFPPSTSRTIGPQSGSAAQLRTKLVNEAVVCRDEGLGFLGVTTLLDCLSDLLAFEIPHRVLPWYAAGFKSIDCLAPVIPIKTDADFTHENRPALPAPSAPPGQRSAASSRESSSSSVSSGSPGAVTSPAARRFARAYP